MFSLSFFAQSNTVSAQAGNNGGNATLNTNTSPDVRAESYTLFKVGEICVRDVMRNTIKTTPGANGATSPKVSGFAGSNGTDQGEWFADDNAFGQVYPNGKRDCGQILQKGISIWGFADGQSFLKAMGYTFDSSVPQWKSPSDDGSVRAERFKQAVNGRAGNIAALTNNEAKHLLYLKAFQGKDPYCQAKRIVAYNNADKTQKDWADANSRQGGVTYTTVTLAEGTGTVKYIYTYDSDALSGVVWRWRGDGVSYGGSQNIESYGCDELAKMISSNAPALASWNEDHSDQAIDPQDVGGIGSGSAEEEEQPTTCQIEGLGWLICPAITIMAGATDALWGWISNFLRVQPLNIDTGSSENTMYNAWTAMRNFANVAFVIAFLLIIYAQLTGTGISNYGVKKMLPRLIVAAILVNISYWVAAVAVDVSNIVGNNIYNILRTGVGLGDITAEAQTWEVVASYVLSLGAVSGTVIAGLTLPAASLGAIGQVALWAFVVFVLSAVLALLIAFIVLAVRQALIIVLIVLSPLAFVAMILPNTEKFFTLWRKSLTTLLIFYPLFAVLFGGSFLAGMIIIGSASSNGSVPGPMLLTFLVGLAVMVLPLWLTPLVMRFSSGIMGQVAGIVNNRSKGLVDRAKNTRRRKSGLAGNEVMQNLSKKNPFNRAYRAIQNSGSRDKDRQKIIDNKNQGTYLATDRSKDLFTAAENARLGVKTLESEHEAHFEEQKDEVLTYRGQVAKQRSRSVESRDKARFEESKSNSQAISPNSPVAQYVQDARDTEREISISESRARSAQGVLQQEFAQELRDRPGMRQRAGGIDPNGESRVLAQAIEAQRKSRESNVSAYSIQHKEQGIPTESLRNMAESTQYSSEEREAASRAVVDSGNIDEIKPHLEYLATALSGARTDEERVAIQNIQKAVGERITSSPGKPMGIGPAEIENLRNGTYTTPTIDASIAPMGPLTAAQSAQLSSANGAQTYNTVVTKGVSAQGWTSIDKNDIKQITQLVELGVIPQARLETLQTSLKTAREDPRISTLIKERETGLLKDLEAKISAQTQARAPQQASVEGQTLQIARGSRDVFDAARDQNQQNPPKQ